MLLLKDSPRLVTTQSGSPSTKRIIGRESIQKTEEYEEESLKNLAPQGTLGAELNRLISVLVYVVSIPKANVCFRFLFSNTSMSKRKRRIQQEVSPEAIQIRYSIKHFAHSKENLIKVKVTKTSARNENCLEESE